MNRLYLLIFLLSFVNLQAQDVALFDEIKLTATIADYGLTGNGTIVAVIDRGIDYRHPDFIKADGTTRILGIFDLSDDSGANAMNNPYGKGTIYTEAQINAALQNNTTLATRDAVGHGHVSAGIAAGNGRGSNGRILGVAPEASIVVVKITSEGAPSVNGQPAEAPFNFIDDYLDDAIDYINDLASTEGMPVSIVANFGSIQGPMDGSSAQSRVIDDRFGPNFPGRAFISGSSDDGGIDNHAGGQFVQGQTVSLQIDKKTAVLRMDLWHHEDDELSIEVVTPSQTYGPFSSPANNSGVNEQNNEFNFFYRGSDIDFFGSTSPRKELLVDFIGPNGVYTLNITGTNVSNGRFDAILNPSRIFGGQDNEFLSFVEPGGTIWDIATAKNNLCPNSYMLRQTWQSVDGNSYSFPGGENGIGSLWRGSGVGPTQDGRFGIDVSVPGNTNFGAYAEDSFFASIRANVVEDGDAVYGTLAAVSGANPVLAGVVALMFEADPTLTATDIKQILQETARADAFTGAVPNNEWGYGKLDVYEAIKSILGPASSTKEVSLNQSIRVSPNPSHDLFFIQQQESIQENLQLQVLDINGRVIKSLVWPKGFPQISIDLGAFGSGVYYLQGIGNNTGFSKKLVKI